MRTHFGRAAVSTLVAIGLVGALAASASADSVTCGMGGRIHLTPGLSETPHQQRIFVFGRLTGCSDKEKGGLEAEMKTAEPVTCATLKGTGAAVSEVFIVFHWALKQESTSDNFSMPLTEIPVALTGAIFEAQGGPPFEGDNISGTATQRYKGTCGGKTDMRKGRFTGSVTIS